jgi:hypothetical protein
MYVLYIQREAARYSLIMAYLMVCGLMKRPDTDTPSDDSTLLASYTIISLCVTSHKSIP